MGRKPGVAVYLRRSFSPGEPFADSRVRLEYPGKIQSAPADFSSFSAEVVGRAITRAPALFPARMPAGASSNTTHSDAGSPSSAAPFRYGSGSGLPCRTSSDVIMFSGIAIPAASSRTRARCLAHEVTNAHRSCGSAFRKSHTPGSGTTPSVSSISPRSTTWFSAIGSAALGSNSLMVVRLGRPCAFRTVSSGSNL